MNIEGCTSLQEDARDFAVAMADCHTVEELLEALRNGPNVAQAEEWGLDVIDWRNAVKYAIELSREGDDELRPPIG